MLHHWQPCTGAGVTVGMHLLLYGVSACVRLSLTLTLADLVLPVCISPCQVIAHELEFINKQAKGQQAKGRARQRRYEELVAAANSYVKNTQVGPEL